MNIQIDDIVLILDISFSPTGGMEFRTDVLEWGDGTEQRSIKWEYPLSSWEFGNRVLVNSDNIQTWANVQAFHSNRRGSERGFYYKDWLDWQGIDEAIGTGNGVERRFQIVKNYASLLGTPLIRKITKIVPDTVQVRLNDIIVNDYIVALDGIIEFGTPPASGVEIKASYDFYVPVRFAQDNIQNSLLTLQGGTLAVELGQLTLEEIRLD